MRSKLFIKMKNSLVVDHWCRHLRDRFVPRTRVVRYAIHPRREQRPFLGEPRDDVNAGSAPSGVRTRYLRVRYPGRSGHAKPPPVPPEREAARERAA